MSWWTYFFVKALQEHGRTMNIVDLFRLVSKQLVLELPVIQEQQMKPTHEVYLRMNLKFSDT